MNCSKIMDMVYEEDSMPFVNQIQVWVHSLFCSQCAQKIELYENSRIILREDFLPELSDSTRISLEDSIMAKVTAEEEAEEAYASPGGLSTRGWIIAGLVILISLATAFFGLDFKRLATESGMSFLLPVGITIGIVLTTYGAFFIGSHLKELSERFGL